MYSLHCTIIHCWSQHTAYPGHALCSNNSHVGGPFLLFCFTHFSLPPSFFTLFSPFMYNPLSYILRLSLRWHPARHTFPPAAQHIIALGPLAPLPRDSGNKPRHYQLLCDPRAPQGGTEAPLGWGEWSWDNTQWALPIRQSIIHCLLVCVFVHLIYNKACFI